MNTIADTNWVIGFVWYVIAIAAFLVGFVLILRHIEKNDDEEKDKP